MLLVLMMMGCTTIDHQGRRVARDHTPNFQMHTDAESRDCVCVDDYQRKPQPSVPCLNDSYYCDDYCKKSCPVDPCPTACFVCDDYCSKYDELARCHLDELANPSETVNQPHGQ